MKARPRAVLNGGVFGDGVDQNDPATERGGVEIARRDRALVLEPAHRDRRGMSHPRRTPGLGMLEAEDRSQCSTRGGDSKRVFLDIERDLIDFTLTLSVAGRNRFSEPN